MHTIAPGTPSGPGPTAARTSAVPCRADTAATAWQAASEIDFSDPHLPVNTIAPDYIPPDRLIKNPDTSPILKDDIWLDWMGARPGDVKTPDPAGEPDPRSWMRAQLEERARVEARGEPFVFAPFLTTLHNMQRLMAHIQAGQQFGEALTPDEAAALARLQEQTAALVTAQTPFYKRSIHLALSLMILCEIITERQVLQPLFAQEPGLLLRIDTTRLYGDPDHNAQILAGLPWTPPPDGTDAPDIPLPYATGVALRQTVNDNSLLLYPSFHPLTLAHFCHLGHLPVHPVGLTAQHACSADGLLMSPLQFAEHDLDHMDSLRRVGQAGHPGQSLLEAQLCCRDKRQQLCQLLLCARPDCLAGMRLDPALTLLLFQLFHEQNPAVLADGVDNALSPFFFFAKALTRARREDWSSYTPDDRQGTDQETLLVALWAACLWAAWRNNDSVPPEALAELARTFADQQVPRLRQHLDFLERHKGTLRQLFIEHGDRQTSGDGRSTYFYPGPLWQQQGSFTLFIDHAEKAGLCHLDNTDLAYLAALHRPALRDLIEARTGARLPQGTAEQDSLAPPP